MALDPISIAMEIGGRLIDRLWPDPTQAAAAKMELLKMQQTGDLAKLTADTEIVKAQLAVNQAEASSTSRFIAGGRPFVVWVCGSALAYVSILEPICRFVASVVFHYTGAFPVIDTTITMQVLLGLLGLGGMRTVEKLKNAEGNR